MRVTCNSVERCRNISVGRGNERARMRNNVQLCNRVRNEYREGKNDLGSRVIMRE